MIGGRATGKANTPSVMDRVRQRSRWKGCNVLRLCRFQQVLPKSKPASFRAECDSDGDGAQTRPGRKLDLRQGICLRLF